MSTTVLGYYGSKHALSDRLMQLMPSHRGYVEPYAGSCAVLLVKPRAAFECVNDLAGDLMTFWRLLRDHCDDLEHDCALTPHSRAEYHHAWPVGEDVDELERARRVWVKLSQSRGGQLRPTGWHYHELTRGGGSGMPATLAAYLGRFAVVADRLRDVSLECLPAFDVITRTAATPKPCSMWTRPTSDPPAPAPATTTR